MSNKHYFKKNIWSKCISEAHQESISNSQWQHMQTKLSERENEINAIRAGEDIIHHASVQDHRWHYHPMCFAPWIIIHRAQNEVTQSY